MQTITASNVHNTLDLCSFQYEFSESRRRKVLSILLWSNAELQVQLLQTFLY